MPNRFRTGDVLDMLSDDDSGEDLDHDSYDFETETDENIGNVSDSGKSEASQPGNFESATEPGSETWEPQGTRYRLTGTARVQRVKLY